MGKHGEVQFGRGSQNAANLVSVFLLPNPSGMVEAALFLAIIKLPEVMCAICHCSKASLCYSGAITVSLIPFC